MPWRLTTDPYAIWISEVMLQQTQVQTVVPYYKKFLELFPTIKDLAEADPRNLLKTWAGLGYYSRARSLQKAAQQIILRHGGTFPRRHEDLIALPGIGSYTAGAILSIAFGQPYPVVDGNVTRVLSRLFLLRGDSKTTRFQRTVWGLAGQLVPEHAPGDFNQALMELGAIICTPRAPRCLFCPWNASCRARLEGMQEELPRKRKGPGSIDSQRAVAVIRKRGRFLIVKRTGQMVLNEFWEFPGGEFNQIKDVRRALVGRIRRDFGLGIRLQERLVTAKYAITRRRITLEVYTAELTSSPTPTPRGRNIRWIRLSDTDRFPFPSATQRILDVLKTRGS